VANVEASRADTLAMVAITTMTMPLSVQHENNHRQESRQAGRRAGGKGRARKGAGLGQIRSDQITSDEGTCRAIDLPPARRCRWHGRFYTKD